MITNWQKYRLGDLVKIKHGFAFKGEFFSDKPTKDILLTPGNFKIGGGFKTDKFKYYKGDIPKDYILKENDILITMTDLSKAGDTLGYAAKIPPHSNIKYLHNQRLGLVQFKNNNIDSEYLYWLLRTREYQYYILGSATGSTVKHTSPSRIQDFEFYAPSDIAEQKRIAEILTSLDDKIELNNQMNQTLEAMVQAIFKEWFVDFKFPGFDGELINGLPKGWRGNKIDDVIYVKGGSTPSTKNTEFWNGENYWATPKDLSNVQFPVLIDTERRITNLGVQQISSKILEKGTLLLSSRAPIGYLAISSVPISINQGFIAIQSKKVSNLFMLFWLKHNMDLVISRSSGSTFKEISKSSFRNIDFVLPEENVLEKFETIVVELFERIIINSEQNRDLMKIRDTLIPKLMNGKIVIKL